MLAHCTCITRDSVRFVTDIEAFECVENRFLMELSTTAPEGYRAGTGDWEILSNLLQAQKRFPRLHIPTIKTVAQLRRLEDRYFSILDPHRVDNLLEYVFPPQPITSNDRSFHAITDPLSVLAEYTSMGPNCIPELIPMIADGHLYAYRVLPDAERKIERATLVICRRRTQEGRWVWTPYDARAPRNEPLTNRTLAAITEFLCRSQGGLTAADLLSAGQDD